MNNNEIETLINKPAAEAIKEYYALSDDERKAIIMAIAEQLDDKYAPQKTVKADESTVNGLMDKRDRLDVTYSLYALVDNTWDIIAMDYECNDVEIPEDETFAEYVEERFDSRISAITDEPGDPEHRDENNYQESEFTRAIYNVAAEHGFDYTGDVLRNAFVDGTYIEFNTRIDISNREYAVFAYFAEEDVAANEDDYGNLNWGNPDFFMIREA